MQVNKLHDLSSTLPQITPITHIDRYVAYFSIAVDKRRDFYITGGTYGNANEPSKKASMLNIKTLEQKELPDLNQARYAHASLILNSQLFVFGGSINSEDVSESIESSSITE